MYEKKSGKVNKRKRPTSALARRHGGPELWSTFFSPMGLRQLAAAARRTADPPPRYNVFGGRRLPGRILPPNVQPKCTHLQLACMQTRGGGGSVKFGCAVQMGTICACMPAASAPRAPCPPPLTPTSPLLRWQDPARWVSQLDTSTCFVFCVKKRQKNDFCSNGFARTEIRHSVLHHQV